MIIEFKNTDDATNVTVRNKTGELLTSYKVFPKTAPTHQNVHVLLKDKNGILVASTLESGHEPKISPEVLNAIAVIYNAHSFT